jgi:hypothetical protein
MQHSAGNAPLHGTSPTERLAARVPSGVMQATSSPFGRYCPLALSPSTLQQPPSAPPSRAMGEIRKWSPATCPLIATIAVLVAGAPPALVSWVGSGWWAGALTWLVVTVCLFFVLVLLGLVDATVELPFGFAIGRHKDDDSSNAIVASALTELRAASTLQGDRSVRTAVVLEAAMERISELEGRVVELETGPAKADRDTPGPGSRS